MPPKSEISIESLITALSNEKVTEALSKALQPLIQSAVDRSIDKLTRELKQRDVVIETLRKDNSELKAKLNNQFQYMEQIETYSKQENLIIHGLPSTMSETVSAAQQSSEDETRIVHESSTTTESTLINFCTSKLGVSIKPTDISICHRLKKKDNMLYPPVIVRFTNRKAREAVLAAKKKLKVLSRDGPRVYINEHLTQNTSKIHATARRLVRSEKLQQTWTHHGRVVIKLLDNRIKTIMSLSELDVYN